MIQDDRRVREALARGGKEIAQAIVFLASDKVDYLTGQIIGVNGGKTAS